MKSKSKNITAAIICCGVVILFLLVISIVGFNKTTAEVHFADPGENSAPVDSGDGITSEGDGLVYISLDKENFSYALETLEKPESYSGSYSVELFWLGGSEKYSVNAFVRGELIHVSSTGSSFTKDVILTGKNYYIWYSDGSALINGERGEVLRKEEIEDAVLMSGSYKKLSELPSEDIIKAEYTAYGSEYCIHISANEGELGYRHEYYISLDTGLLLLNEIYDGSEIVYRLALSGAKLSAPDDSCFLLPDGSLAE